MPGHAGPGGVDGELELAVAAPVDGDAVAINRPVGVRGVLLAHKVVEAVCMELDLTVGKVESHVRNSHGMDFGRTANLERSLVVFKVPNTASGQ